MKEKSVLIIGNSSGIGLALTKRLLSLGYQVIGLSKSRSPVADEAYRHIIADVTDDSFCQLLADEVTVTPDLVIYCAGIGEEFDLSAIVFERKVFEVNLMGAVKTIEALLPKLVENRRGHIIVLSSLADQLISPEAPSYSASKAGLSSYTEGLALVVRQYGVAITNVRFGFVATKMAKGASLPFMMSVDRAVDHLMRCLSKQPIRYSRPRLMAVIVLLVRLIMRLKLLFARRPY